MSTYRDPKAERPRSTKSFWAPVWIISLGCAGVLLFEFGGYLTQQEWLKADNADLTVRAMSSPSDALRVAEQRLEAGRVDFALYRDLLKKALSQHNPDVSAAAFESMDKLLASNLAFADDLRRDLASWPPQVLITTTEAGGSVGSTIETELKLRGMEVFVRATGDPKALNKTQVFCYEQGACTKAAQSVVDVLQEKGYAVAKAAPPGDGFGADGKTQYDEAAKLYDKKRIEIVLADEKKIAPNKPVLAVLRHPRPHSGHERQVVAITSPPAK